MATPKQILPGRKAAHGDTLPYAHISVKAVSRFFCCFSLLYDKIFYGVASFVIANAQVRNFMGNFWR
jgi:hypothetical protein